MATLTFKEGDTFQSDNKTIYQVAAGSVNMAYSGGATRIEKGGMLGALELFLPEPSFTYEALTDVTLQTLAIPDITSLQTQITAKPSIGKALFNIALKQFTALSKDFEMQFYEVDTLYNSLKNDYEQYATVCKNTGGTPNEPEEMDGLMPPYRPSDIAITAFYEQFIQDPNCALLKEVASNAWTAAAFIYHLAYDSTFIVKSFENLEAYHMRLISCYMNPEGTGLVNLVLSTAGKFSSITPEVDELLNNLRFSLTSLEADPCVEEDVYEAACKQLDTMIASLSGGPLPVGISDSDVDNASSISNAEAEEGIANSLQTILAYSGIPIADRDTIFENVRAFEKLPDRASTDDTARKICRQISQAFNQVYSACAKKAVTDPDVPVVVKMLLYFGYMDEAVASREMAVSLYKIAAVHTIDPDTNVYPFFDWLCAIYQGKKEPSRNEFEQDYTDSIHAMKVSNKITAAEERELLEDQLKKVEYELENVFPSVNKITYGRISTYCPIFSSHNLPASLSKSMVEKDKVNEIIDYVMSVDFSAFAREVLYSNPKIGLNKDFVHVDVMPDFILLPNVGMRGAMWQEIEAKKRSTPCRMMLPIFLLGELQPAILRMTGEYRWEMCKRIQGARWNDLSDPSLTSEFFDYIQFYRKNIELSADAKEKIKNNLVRAKNNYKEMFLIDYLSWVVYESAGSPRLNKVSRAILSKYCPFRKEIRDKLGSNPQFTQLFERYNHQMTQVKHKYEVLRQKMSNAGLEFPEELQREWEYLER